MKRSILRVLYNRETEETLKCLYPCADPKKQMDAFYKKKAKVFLLAVFLSAVLAAAAAVTKQNPGELIEGRLIRREDYEGKQKTVELLAVNGFTGEEETIEVDVREKRYSDQVLNRMLAEIEEEVPQLLLGENPSAESVSGDLKLMEKIPGYPFAVSYKTDHPLILSSDGRYHEDRLSEQLQDPSEGIYVKIVMTLLYEDFRGEISCYIRVVPPEKSGEKSFKETVTEAIERASEESREEDYLSLPERLNEIPVSYREKSSSQALLILIIGFAVAYLLYKREDDNLSSKLKERNKQMLEDYPMIVNKFALFYSVGMTTKGIFLKLCRDYEEEKKRKKRKKEKCFRYVYEEMLLTRAKMEEGIGETAAYEDFARRCKHPKYRQLVNLMEQAVNKGKNDISLVLSREVSRAFTERKNHAKELGEEAGTKLLLPMFLMLLVVIIVIMIPAFLAFQL